ncbi:hypothetical protein RJ641_013098 [Dillenia turbinata]|uniref:Uncharacterized protein n=1 Tax=Dillenia turbinata TaxID=194707 RepID=A0AAN8ZL43_9MAGN
MPSGCHGTEISLEKDQTSWMLDSPHSRDIPAAQSDEENRQDYQKI